MGRSVTVLLGLFAFNELPELDVVDEVIFVNGLSVGTPGHGALDVFVTSNHLHDRIPLVRMTAVRVLHLFQINKKVVVNKRVSNFVVTE